MKSTWFLWFVKFGTLLHCCCTWANTHPWVHKTFCDMFWDFRLARHCVYTVYVLPYIFVKSRIYGRVLKALYYLYYLYIIVINFTCFAGYWGVLLASLDNGRNSSRSLTKMETAGHRTPSGQLETASLIHDGSISLMLWWTRNNSKVLWPSCNRRSFVFVSICLLIITWQDLCVRASECSYLDQQRHHHGWDW